MSHSCITNMMQKLYNKIHLNDALVLTFFHCKLCTLVLLLLTKYSFHVQRLFSKMKLVKTLLPTQLKWTNLENTLQILTESPKEGFNDTVFHYFVDELKHCNPDMRTDLHLVPGFLLLYSVHLVVMLPFRVVYFHNVFCFII